MAEARFSIPKLFSRRTSYTDRPAALKAAILDGDLRAVENQIISGVDVSQRVGEKVPLALAIESGHEDIAISLIKASLAQQLSFPPFSPTPKRQRNASNTFAAIIVEIVLGASIIAGIDYFLSYILPYLNRIDNLRPVYKVLAGGARFGLICRTAIAALIASTFSNTAKGSLGTYVRAIPIEILLATLQASSNTTHRNFATWCFQPTGTAAAGRLFLSSLLNESLNRHSQRICQHLRQPPDYKGVEVLDALFRYKGGTDRVITALLDLGIFSRDYVKTSLMFRNAYPAKAIWWVADRGFHRPVRQLLGLGFPPDYVHSHRWAIRGSGFNFSSSLATVSAGHGHFEVLRGSSRTSSTRRVRERANSISG
jgi:hypothetical protein